jgi:D-threonate/D-erythronate kinase
MIVVIADDLTGAAEIGGVGLQHGLTVEVVTSPKHATGCDLLVIDTDTRSLSLLKARAKTRMVMEQVMALHPTYIFKKIDSVLRGHVLVELRALQKITKQKQAFIVAGNPMLNRTIRDGFYYVQDLPIHKTSFAKDPEFPVKSYFVDDMLRAGGIRISILPVGWPLPTGGTTVADVQTTTDFAAWAKALQPHPEILLAGTSLFFAAVLKQKGFEEQTTIPELHSVKQPALFVSGTAFSERVAIIRQLAEESGPVCYAPQSLFQTKMPSKKGLLEWVDTTAAALKGGKAVLAFDGETVPEGTGAVALRKITAQVVELLMERAPVQELIIEGGSTAAAIFKTLHIHRLQPVQELVPGVVRMKTDDISNLFVTVKPGSYPWPAGFWNFKTERHKIIYQQ